MFLYEIKGYQKSAVSSDTLYLPGILLHFSYLSQLKKNAPWHILVPSAVACDMFLLRASAHPAERFLLHRTQFPMKREDSHLFRW